MEENSHRAQEWRKNASGQFISNYPIVQHLWLLPGFIGSIGSPEISLQANIIHLLLRAVPKAADERHRVGIEKHGESFLFIERPSVR